MDLNTTLLVSSESELVLSKLPKKPFFCLPISAVLYSVLRDNHGIDAKLVTGNLLFKDEYIFKQDFSLSIKDHGEFKLWAGHAWVEVYGTIWDLSFFHTLYSDAFRKPFKDELLKLWGLNQQLIVSNKPEITEMYMCYKKIDTLSDEMATGIIRGMDQIP